jgi:hypothetical protein
MFSLSVFFRWWWRWRSRPSFACWRLWIVAIRNKLGRNVACLNNATRHTMRNVGGVVWRVVSHVLFQSFLDGGGGGAVGLISFAAGCGLYPNWKPSTGK